ncbi:hypothetical protein ACHHYP_14544 [Achlya hypogyna]|uniref:Damage-inducible protein DinB n=1 Tax=Achlya hypogyna TaxID=1202772 RepID=A0A1V9YCW6_ACHHY|nr:hypothetical protein ACHHYP_14544 [Achlya hypogyna]
MRLLRTFARYNVWAHERLLASVAALSDEAYHGHQNLPFRSIHGTLNHILLAEKLLLGRLHPPAADPSLGRNWDRADSELYAAPGAASIYWEEIVPNRACLADELVDHARRLAAHVDTIPSSDTVIAYQTTDGCSAEKAAGVLVLHAVNHATHHRGQVSAVLAQLKLPPPIMDLSYFPHA